MPPTALRNSLSEYSDLKSIDYEWAIAYGPVQSRRLGLSLGINLLGKNKICSFDCPYCELGETKMRMNQLKLVKEFPSVSEVDLALRERLRALANEEKKIDAITISGNGEPTLHPEFMECVQALLTVRSEMLPETKLVVLTNGAHADNKRVVHGLNLLDERMLKIDAGNDRAFKMMNKPLVRANLSKITSGARKLKDVIVQSMFVQGATNNTTPECVEEWLEVVGIIHPKAVQIYTLDRVPALSGLKKADEDTLYTIASRLKRKLQVEISVFA